MCRDDCLNLIDSNGVVDEVVLDKLKLNVRSLLESEAGKDKELLDLCLDVIYHQNMKALGLKNLIDLYNQYSKEQKKNGDQLSKHTFLNC